MPDLSDPTVADKVLLLYFSGSAFGKWMPEDREEIKARVDAELPAFLDYLTAMEVPEQLRATRFGQVPYKNPVALEKYFSATHEASLMEIIDEELFTGFSPPEYWEGRARDLEVRLRANRDVWRQCEKLGATGQGLGKMLHAIARNPSTRLRVRVTTRSKQSFYRILPPPKGEV